jgi:hypothetical protein
VLLARDASRFNAAVIRRAAPGLQRANNRGMRGAERHVAFVAGGAISERSRARSSRGNSTASASSASGSVSRAAPASSAFCRATRYAAARPLVEPVAIGSIHVAHQLAHILQRAYDRPTP